MKETAKEGTKAGEAIKEVTEDQAKNYDALCRTVYEIEELKPGSFLEKAPEGATAYRIIGEFWNSFKVEYYGKKE
jgi:hypothetical protein